MKRFNFWFLVAPGIAILLSCKTNLPDELASKPGDSIRISSSDSTRIARTLNNDVYIPMFCQTQTQQYND